MIHDTADVATNGVRCDSFWSGHAGVYPIQIEAMLRAFI